MVLGLRVGQHRRQEPADDAQHCQRPGVLDDREHSRAGGDDHHGRGRGHGRQDVVHREGGVGGDVEHRDAAALEAHAVNPPPVALAPTYGQEHQPEDGRGGQPRLDGQFDNASPVGLPEQQPDPDQRDQHTHLHRRVAGGHPLLDPVRQPRDRVAGRLPHRSGTVGLAAGSCGRWGLRCPCRRVRGSGRLGSHIGPSRRSDRGPSLCGQAWPGVRGRGAHRLCLHRLCLGWLSFGRLCLCGLRWSRLSLGRLRRAGQPREPGVGLLGPLLHLGRPGLHLSDPGLGLLDLLQPPAEIELLAHQKAEGASEQQTGKPGDSGAQPRADHGEQCGQHAFIMTVKVLAPPGS